MVFADVNVSDIFLSQLSKIYENCLFSIMKITEYSDFKNLQEIVYLENSCKNIVNEFGKFKEYLSKDCQKVIEGIETIDDGLESFIQTEGSDENLIEESKLHFQNLVNYIKKTFELK